MSRGRGGGRGRGRGGSNSARDNFNAAFKDMSKEDSRALFESFSKPVKGSGMLYPPLEKPSELPGMTPLEERVIVHTNELLRDIGEGPVGPNGQRTGAPWRLASERKVVGIEIESYSDRYRRPNKQATTGTTTLDTTALKLQRDLFPPSLWAEYFEGQEVDVAKLKAHERAAKRRKALEGDGEDDEGSAQSEEEDDDFDFEEDDEEDHQDYDANYFDNGEGDDDSAGEGGEDEGGRYDD